ncbi:MAG TPA: EcsC family protein [Usitatibacter sp.]|nr:EcsC family protein [Usitatibacter sp.]
MPFSKEELDELRQAKLLLENPGLAAKLASYVGSPVEKGMKMLPKKWQAGVHSATEKALMKALDVAVRSLANRSGTRTGKGAQNAALRFAVATSGAVGGAFGLIALGVELPISTTIILRSIADIAASEGEDPRHIDTKLACLVVFALGSPTDASDNAAESGYFAARSALATAVTEASKHLAQKGLAKGGGPALVRLVSLIAARFGVVVSEKTAAQLVPVIGAAGGALINTLFIAHYQDMARGHFIVRRLEKIHGAEPVRLAYEKL